jgi:hypothetical protein
MPGNTSPSPQAIFPQSLVGFTVEENGVIQTMPTRFGVGSNELVVWVVANISTQNIKVSVEKFQHNGVDLNPAPILWLMKKDFVHVAKESAVFLVGIRNPAYRLQSHLLFDRVTYTIHVEGPGFSKDYDPDGDIKP